MTKFLPILLLLVGLAATVYLVSSKTPLKIFPKAYENTVSVKQKIKPIKPKSEGELASSIVEEGYKLLDDYVKSMSSYSCIFDHGQFSFTWEDSVTGYDIILSPGCGNFGQGPEIVRQISFVLQRGNPNEVKITILGKSPYGQSAPANPEAMNQAKSTLKDELVKHNLLVKTLISKEPLQWTNYNLSKNKDVRTFFDEMKRSIVPFEIPFKPSASPTTIPLNN